MDFSPYNSRHYPADLELLARQYLAPSSSSVYPSSSDSSSTYPVAASYGLEKIDAEYDPLERFFLGKKISLARGVEDITGLIEEREILKYTNNRNIDYESCLTKTKVFELEHWHLGANPSIDKMRSTFERELLSFEREKRMEEVACWRDVARLKSELREATKELDQENRRGDLFK